MNHWILILGATSDIATATAHQYARHGYNILVGGRDEDALRALSSDLSIRHGVCSQIVLVDALECDPMWYDSLDVVIEGVIVAIGYLPATMDERAEIHKTIQINYTGLVTLLAPLVVDFEHRGHGFIVGISSVAGDRGRGSNYLYGSAKAAFSAYLSGLRNRLHRANVSVLSVKPGFVATRMTEKMQLPKPLVASPERVARDIYHAQHHQRDILYTLPIWRVIMLIILHIPERIFKRLSL